MAPVRFAHSQYFDAEQGVVLFTAFHHGSVIPCAVSAHTLADQFGADPDAPLANFVRQRYLIERLAEELILEERFEADGSVLICCGDCGWLREAMGRPAQAGAAADSAVPAH